MRNNVPVPAPTYALPFPFIVHLPLPPTTLSPSTKYSGESHKGWLLQLVDIMAWDGGMHQHGQRLTDADRHSLSLRGAERAAALHPSSPLQPRSIATEILSSPSSSFEPVPTYPPFPLLPPTPPSPSTSNVPSRFLQPPPPPPRPGHRQYHATPVAPVVITSIHFTLKAGAGVVPKRAPREPHFRYGLPYARPPFLPSPPPSQPFPKFARLQGREGGRGEGLIVVQTRFRLVSSPNFSPRSEKISMTLPPHLVDG